MALCRLVKSLTLSVYHSRSCYIRIHCLASRKLGYILIFPSARIIWNGRFCKWNVIILSDRQAAIKALSSNVMNSKTVYDCCRYLDEIMKRYNIHIA